MKKAQALPSFLSSFGLPAYEQSTVPDGAPLPRITFSSVTDSLGNVVNPPFSVWYRDTSWEDIEAKTEEISKAIGLGGVTIRFDGGILWIVRGSPFAQRMDDDDDMIRRMYINLQAEYLSAD